MVQDFSSGILGLWRHPPSNRAFHPSFQGFWSTRTVWVSLGTGSLAWANRCDSRLRAHMVYSSDSALLASLDSAKRALISTLYGLTAVVVEPAYGSPEFKSQFPRVAIQFVHDSSPGLRVSASPQLAVPCCYTSIITGRSYSWSSGCCNTAALVGSPFGLFYAVLQFCGAWEAGR